jgi:zinc D-Ala-D-Ala carboxypeptidase
MTKDLQLSPNFWLSEFVKSQTASRHGINNSPSTSAIENLRLLCRSVLQPLRDEYKMPVVISSGYRSRALNSLVRGSSSSQHCSGQAADFTIPGVSNLALIQWVRSHLQFDQLILEYWSGGNSGWIHCSFNLNHNRQQFFEIK